MSLYKGIGQNSFRVDEDDDASETADKDYWLKRGSLETVKIADKLAKGIKGLAEGFQLKYNKFYIGLVKDGQPNNFVLFRPRKKDLNLQKDYRNLMKFKD